MLKKEQEKLLLLTSSEIKLECKNLRKGENTHVLYFFANLTCAQKINEKFGKLLNHQIEHVKRNSIASIHVSCKMNSYVTK